VVIDTGSHFTKIGFASEDRPQCVIRTATGVSHVSNSPNGSKMSKYERYLLDSALLQPSHPNTLVKHPYEGGTIHDMDALASIWYHGMRSKLRMSEDDIRSTPVLLSEPSFWSNTNNYAHLFAKYRESYAQCIFEEFECEHMYVLKDSVLCSLAHGLTTSMVLELGSSCTRCVPICDGYVIESAAKYSKCGGNLLDEILYQTLTADINMHQLSTHFDGSQYSTSLKQHIIQSAFSDVREKVCAVRNTKFDSNGGNLTFAYKHNDSYRVDALSATNNKYAPPLLQNSTNNVMHAPSILHHAGTPNVKTERSRSRSPRVKLEKEMMTEQQQSQDGNSTTAVVYTLPDGQRIMCGDWQYSIPEIMFIDYHEIFGRDLEDDWMEQLTRITAIQADSYHTERYNRDPYYFENCRKIWTDDTYETFKFKGLSSMIVEAFNDCDVDIKAQCVQNIVIGGGHSRYRGLIERISKELALQIPYACKYKLHFNRVPYERIFNAWIGGALLARTAGLQNKWITKEEYNEYGAHIIHKKCD